MDSDEMYKWFQTKFGHMKPTSVIHKNWLYTGCAMAWEEGEATKQKEVEQLKVALRFCVKYLIERQIACDDPLFTMPVDGLWVAQESYYYGFLKDAAEEAASG